ncbi:MAG TPA: hypothetical protein VH092_25075 [Urbifossiella sp.]|nr:hypothetical protein [Urbifossiella sp.]
MATLFKPTRPYLLPPGAEVVEKDGRPHARVREKGKAVLYPLSADGASYLKPAAKWAADVRLADGTRKRVRFSPNRDAAALMLADLLKRIENEKAGIRDDYADHRKRPLGDLLAAYERHVLDKGATGKEAAQAARRCEIVFGAVGFVTLKDLDATPAEPGRVARLAGEVGEAHRGRGHDPPRPGGRPGGLARRGHHHRRAVGARAVGLPVLPGPSRPRGRFSRPPTHLHHRTGTRGGGAEGREGVGPALDDHPDDGPVRPRRHPGYRRRGRPPEPPDPQLTRPRTCGSMRDRDG